MHSQSDSIRNTQPKSTSSLISTASDGSEFYGHLLIGDNFFLEMAHIDLERKFLSNIRSLDSKIFDSNSSFVPLQGIEIASNRSDIVYLGRILEELQ